jgi:homopolymeric O-antigen transport system ATP-binding protein
MTTRPAVRFEGVSKVYHRGMVLPPLRQALARAIKNPRQLGRIFEQDDPMYAVRDLSFELAPGETLGVIGPNGAGKSTVLKLIAGITDWTSGQIEINGRVGALIEVGAGFHPELTGRENIHHYAAILGMSRREIKQKIEPIIEFSGVGDYIDTPVKLYSSGMYVRLGFSVAVHLDPDILLIDEVLSVGDMQFRRQCLDRMQEIKKRGTSIVFVSHYMQHVDGFCDRAIFINRGVPEVIGQTSDAIQAYESAAYSGGDANTGGLGHWSDFHTGEIEIRDVKFTDEAGNEKKTFRPDDAFYARVNYFAPRRYDDPVFSFALYRDDGVYAVRERTIYHGIKIPFIEGAGSFVVELKPLQLNGGRYRSEIIIWDRDIVVPFVDRMRDEFVVTSYMPPIPGNIGQSVFHPHLTWHISEPGETD